MIETRNDERHATMPGSPQDGETALIYASYEGHAALVDLLLADSRTDINFADGVRAILFDIC